MKNKNTFRKWMALFLSISMVAASGITSNVRLRAAEDTPVQETTAEGTTNEDANASASDNAGETTVSNVEQNDTTRTEEIGLNGTEQAAEESAAPSAEENKNAETAAEAEQGATPATTAESEKKETVADSTASSSVSSSSEEEDKNLTAAEQIDEARKDATKREYSYDDDLVSVTATLDDPKAVPDNAEFRVTPVTKDSTDYNYDAYMNALNDDAAASSGSDTEKQYTDENTLLYDMAFIYPVEEKDEDGNVTQKEVEVQPAEGAVKISIDFKKDQLTNSLDAEKDSDVEIKHLPLTEAVKESTDTTADATNISAADVKVEDVTATNLSVDESTLSFRANNFSVYAVSSNEHTGIAEGTSRDYKSILGKAVEYGIVADTYTQKNHTQTNFAVNTYKRDGDNVIEADIAGPQDVPFYIGDFSTNGLRFGGSTNSSSVIYDVYTNDSNSKITNDKPDKITVNRLSSEYNASFVNKLIEEITTMSRTLANESNVNTLNEKNVDQNNYIIDTRSAGDNATIYFNVDKDDTIFLNAMNCSGGIHIRKKPGQTIIFNILKDDIVTLCQFQYAVGSDSYTTTHTDQKDTENNRNLDQQVCQKIIWNFVNAKTVNLDTTAGIILAPNANVNSGNTSQGWIVAGNEVTTNSEWHFAYRGRTYHSKGSAFFTAKKVFLVNNQEQSLSEGQFKFALYKGENPSGDAEPVEEATNSSDGTISFGKLTYNENDVKNSPITYTVKEIAGTDKQISYDTTSYKIRVYLTDNGNGTISTTVKLVNKDGTEAELSSPDQMTFTNTKNQESAGSLKFEGTKSITNKPANMSLAGYQFKVVDEKTDKTVATGTSGEDGKITFTAINYTLADAGKTYNYAVSEVNGGQKIKGVTYDDKSYKVTVKVTDNGTGELQAEMTGDTTTGKDLKFTNTYAASGSVSFGGMKTLEGQDLTAGEFGFRIMEGLKEVATVTNKADGTIEYPTIDYSLSDAGKHTYTIYEVNGGKSIDGVKYDGTKYTVNVTVTDNGDGTLKVVKDSIGDALNFTNTYGSSSTSVTLGGNKTLENYPEGVQNPVFTFKLNEESGDYQDTATVEGSGQYRFKTITYDAPGQHVYKVTESVGENAGVIYDSTTYEVTVNVTDNRKGELKATISTTKDGKAYRKVNAEGVGLDFTNKYEAKAASAVIYGSKTINGGSVKVKAGQFRFNLLEGDKVIDTAANDADGNYVFSNLKYTSAGTHTYTIEEQNAGKTIDGIKYQDAERTVTITVKDDGLGKLVANNARVAAFDNTQFAKVTVSKDWDDEGNESYRPSSVVIDLIDTATGAVVKKLELSEVNGWSMSYDQLEAGKSYTVHEEENDEFYKALNNDQVVTADVNGTLVGLRNKFIHKPVTVYANKVLNGGTLTNGEFTFALYRNSDPDKVYRTAANTASGEIFFTDVEYDEKGYTVREIQGSDPSVAYDSDAIEYDAEGNVTSASHAVLTNTVRPIVLRVQKRSRTAPYDPLPGATYGLYEVVEGGNDILIESQVSDENGYMYFGKIQPSTDGETHIYYFKEIAAPEGHEVDPYVGQKFQVRYTGNGEIALYSADGTTPVTIGDITSQNSENLLVQHTSAKTALNTAGALTYSDSKITATAQAVNGAFEAGTTMKVVPLTGSDLKDAQNKVEIACGKIANNVAYYNVEFVNAKGAVVEPAYGDVTVTIQYKDSLKLPEGTDAKALKIVHLKEQTDGTEVQAVAGTIASKSGELLQASFTSDSFSKFGIVEPSADNSSLNSNYLVTAAGVSDQVSRLNIAKLDTSGKYLKGARLQIIDKATGNVMADWTTTDGPETFARWFDEAQTKSMNVDTYYILHEVSAPEGYQLADDILFKINKYDSSITIYKMDENGNLVADQEAIDKWVSDHTLDMIDVPVEYQTKKVRMQKTVKYEKLIQGKDKVVYVRNAKAVKTGDASNIAMYAILLAAAGAVLILLFRTRREGKGKVHKN